MSLLASLTTIRYYTAGDPYFYTVDNRPLTDIEVSLETIATYIDTGIYESKVVSSSATGGIGYSAGAGGTISQSVDKTTAVTLDKVTGTITMHNATLNAATTVTFTFNNTALAATDLLVVNHVSAGTAGAYTITPQVTGSGTASISVRNVTAGNLGEAIVLGFAIIKSVTA